MRGWVVLGVLAAGCAREVQVARFQLGRPEPLGGAAAAAELVGATLDEHRLELCDCFDELGERRETLHRLVVALTVRVREGAMAVAEVEPLDRATITDAGLVACLADRLARWPVGGGDGDLTVTLAVAPRALPRAAAAASRAVEAPRLVPEE